MSAAWVSALVVRAAVRVLPAGAARERYRREFLGELAACGRTARMQFTLGVLGSILALRAALAGSALLVSPSDLSLYPEYPKRRPWLCRMRLHHWVECHNPDGDSYLQCRRCGQDHFELRPNSPGNITGNLFGQQWPM